MMGHTIHRLGEHQQGTCIMEVSRKDKAKEAKEEQTGKNIFFFFLQRSLQISFHQEECSYSEDHAAGPGGAPGKNSL